MCAGDKLKRKKDDKEIFEVIFYLCFLLVSLYFLSILLSPLFIQSDNRVVLGLGTVGYLLNVLMCHQLPERSFELFGQYMPICSRDVGLVAGAFLACLLSFRSSKLPRMLKSGVLAILSIVPIGIDGTMQLLNFWESTDPVRFATGLISGFFISYYAINVFLGEPRLSRRTLQWTWAFLPLLLAILAASVYVGSSYRTKSEIISKTKAINNAMDIRVFYIAPRAFSSSIARDPYLSRYDDTVLGDVVMIGDSGHPYGVWVAVVSNASNNNGRYIFASGSGENYFYDASSGELIGKFVH
jgi:uncharacterized membrane protein